MNIDTIICGDSIETMGKMPDGCVDLVFTSPPYFNAREYSLFKSYKEYLDFLRGAMEQIVRVLSDDGFFILNTSPVIVPRKSRSHESERLPIPFDSFSLAMATGFKYIDDIVWEKPDGASNRAIKFAHHRRPMAYKPFAITEYLFVFRKSNAPLIDRGIRKHSAEEIRESLVSDGYERTNVWKINPARKNGHPAPFPSELARKVISYYSFVGDLVLDPFCGSGTTCKQADTLKRHYIGIDASQEYCEMAKKSLYPPHSFQLFESIEKTASFVYSRG